MMTIYHTNMRYRYIITLRCGKMSVIEGVACKCVDQKNHIYHIMDKDDEETLTERRVAIINQPDLIQIEQI